MHKKLRLWALLEGLTALVLLAVSAAFSLVLFVGFARVSWQVPLYAALAISFESSKSLLWIAGVVKDRLFFRVLAVCFAVLSLGASATTLLGEASATVQFASSQDGLRASLERSIASAEAGRDAYSQAYRDYRAVTADFNARIEADRAALLALSSSSSRTATASANNFSSLAAVFVRSDSEALADLLRLLYLSLVVVGIEVGGFALSSAALKQLKADASEAAPKQSYVGAHIVARSNASMAQTVCGRVFGAAKIQIDAPQVLCPDCAKGKTA